MPYVPSKKTDGYSTDREQLDVQVELAAKVITTGETSFGILQKYKQALATLGCDLTALLRKKPYDTQNPLAETIFSLGESYGYEGAFLGELNYAVTRIIQRVPQIMVETGKWAEKDELRYWLYAITVQALVYAANYFSSNDYGIGGVFEDIKDEYKRRVNASYEAAQILKNGDCYDTPYYTRLVEVIDQSYKHVGHIEIMLKRSEATLGMDVLPFQLKVGTPTFDLQYRGANLKLPVSHIPAEGDSTGHVE